ncbi:PAS-domain containing protein [Jannaschia seohaensis]|uniref:PAS domain-containing protein n=1 Tax=Jannaschia seohaensis TaxID=475081 RepID=A0A2Y9A4X3_9RHOB|nr:PAS-domain containing protein [Jannaschia seohaensis]PWJ22230.1 PAS domain-containing protein [Jannaschia seohaensis]SSA38508.1 PAS fold [Jannaschia seohaensis]
MTWGSILFLFLLPGALAGALALSVTLWLIRAKPRRVPPVILGTLSEPRSFVFRDGYLVAHSDNVGFLLPEPIDHLRAWDSLIDNLGQMVDGTFAAFEALEQDGRSFRLEGRLGTDRLHILGLREGSDLRISVTSAEGAETAMRIEIDNLRALEDENALLTRAADSSPTASWRLDTEGRVVWANAAYQDLVARYRGEDASRGWPLTDLFESTTAVSTGRSRRQLTGLEGEDHWFEIVAGGRDAHGMRHLHAVALDSVVAAEESLRIFMQTLTKTFAYLPTGLAIFDRDRRLAMFNPALMDMAGLEGGWLSRRPTLEAFFDALRERRRLPEPRDYKAWRERLSDLGRVGEGGTYRETWSLPTGQIYRVTGRPYADGAIALMFEDVSADIYADRAHREERDALAHALSASEDALVVFDAEGRRVAANPMAQSLLPPGRDGTLPETLDDAILIWRSAFSPSSAWAEIRDAARGSGPTAQLSDWTETLHRTAGTDVTMRVVPKRGGGLALGFCCTTMAEEVRPASVAAE